MNATTLPFPTSTFSSTILPDLFPQAECCSAFPPVEKVWPQGTILRGNTLGMAEDVRSLHLTVGCMPRAICDPARLLGTASGEQRIRLQANAAERLHRELLGSGKPRAVQICPWSDPFPPLLEVQAETARVVEVLARHEVQAWMATRGHVRPAILEALIPHREQIKWLVGLTTLDRSLQRLLEPLSAPPRLRLKQIARLRALGFAVQVALDPLVPGLTDTRDNLLPVLEALAELGISQVSAGYLFLPGGCHEQIQQALQPHHWDALVLDAYARGPRLRSGGQTAHFLPKIRRERGYAALMALAANAGITVRLNAMSNPDFARPVLQLTR